MRNSLKSTELNISDLLGVEADSLMLASQLVIDTSCMVQVAPSLTHVFQSVTLGKSLFLIFSFFSVDMPNYSTKEIMKERLLYTLNNCQAIDGDGGSFVAFFDDEM